jgi:hypothetical protein
MTMFPLSMAGSVLFLVALALLPFCEQLISNGEHWFLMRRDVLREPCYGCPKPRPEMPPSGYG